MLESTALLLSRVIDEEERADEGRVVELWHKKKRAKVRFEKEGERRDKMGWSRGKKKERKGSAQRTRRGMRRHEMDANERD